MAVANVTSLQRVHVETLQKMRSGALAAGLFIGTENVNRQQLIEKWTDELKSQWPCCILFMNGQQAGQVPVMVARNGE